MRPVILKRVNPSLSLRTIQSFFSTPFSVLHPPLSTSLHFQPPLSLPHTFTYPFTPPLLSWSCLYPWNPEKCSNKWLTSIIKGCGEHFSASSMLQYVAFSFVSTVWRKRKKYHYILIYTQKAYVKRRSNPSENLYVRDSFYGATLC